VLVMPTAVTVRTDLAAIAVNYQVPAYLGAPVMFEGRPGKVVGADQGWLIVKLDGERDPDLYHPRWHMQWPEDNGRATACGPVKPAPALLLWGAGEAQWSGV
jgi:hypothetical protein